MSPGFGGWLRFMLVGTVLWLLWVEWRPAGRPWPEDLDRPASAEELRRLPVGRGFLLSGRVEPLPDAPVREWQGRFVFRHRQRQDLSTSGGKTVRMVTVAEHRPALRWVWAGGAWEIPADSYGLENAPRIEPRFWPRKWLWTTRVDDWDRSSTGIRAGETVWVRGEAGASGAPVVTEIWGDPWEPILARQAGDERMRRWLIFGAKVVASVFALALLVPRWRRDGGRSS